MGSLASQSLWGDATTFRRCSSTVRLWMQGCSACLIHSEALQYLLHRTGLEVTGLITVQLPRYSEAAEEVGHQGFRHRRRLALQQGAANSICRSLDIFNKNSISLKVIFSNRSWRQLDCFRISYVNLDFMYAFSTCLYRPLVCVCCFCTLSLCCPLFLLYVSVLTL
jgi:hypothetical protein